MYLSDVVDFRGRRHEWQRSPRPLPLSAPALSAAVSSLWFPRITLSPPLCGERTVYICYSCTPLCSAFYTALRSSPFSPPAFSSSVVRLRLKVKKTTNKHMSLLIPAAVFVLLWCVAVTSLGRRSVSEWTCLDWVTFTHDSVPDSYWKQPTSA